MALVVMVCCDARGDSTPHDDKYVVAWNPHVPYGVLAMESSPDKAKARRFARESDVLDEMRTVSNVEPVRPDGVPNRPLNSIIVMMESD